MPLQYPDAYLAKFCTIERESRAYDEVDAIGTFDTAWRERLTVLRCYLLACLENMSQPDDLFAAKLKNYRDEFNVALAQAQAATPDADGNTLPIFSIPLERC